MSKKNIYELRTEVHGKIQGGATAADLWDKEYRINDARQELRHLVGENPTTPEYNKQIRGLLDSVESNLKVAKDIGPLAEADYRLNTLSEALAGSVLRSMVSLEPKTLPEAKAVNSAYNALSKQVSKETLEGGIAHLPAKDQEVYQLDIVRLYGEAKSALGGDGVAGD